MAFYILVLITGLVVGSFLNVCIYRIPQGETVVTTPSHCFACGTRLKPWDLVPLFSYLLLRGKCRYCRVKISVQYPLVELITGLLFLATIYYWGISWQALAMLVFFSVLMVTTVIDIHHQIIPDSVLLVGGLLGLPIIFFQSLDHLKWGLIGFFAAGLLLLLIALLSKGGMGGGDIKLAAVMGLYLGLKPVAIALFLSFLLGGAVGILLLATGIKGRKDPVPFGPFLAAGAIISAFLGERIIVWYLGFL
ncbi:type 4 prepilin peptidase 1, Aspartic peptidase, MEROPS family A24A [Desulforamulus reducens MI-1]|uniref:Prepilin leader peptidase/N-methyltransferase n=1 Tax=Desulforamulus reducens (strain ATCC BAA-1160 / DSM 100696 / MI-1) TaxID=349161 RepID=A4J3C9_DESRM|nr:A24 family peptidase [Desulforamulus reducens]ABO49582.1 type 4 prepilin peptidase 1, Aspartic peptidase, MEROPS family A24A [Desulforamulus reducens MI-1]